MLYPKQLHIIPSVRVKALTSTIIDLADGGDLLNYVMEFKDLDLSHSFVLFLKFYPNYFTPSCSSTTTQQIKGNRAKKLFFDLSRAMSYIHARGIAHRDLKGENVLLRLGASVSALWHVSRVWLSHASFSTKKGQAGQGNADRFWFRAKNQRRRALDDILWLVCLCPARGAEQ